MNMIMKSAWVCARLCHFRWTSLKRGEKDTYGLKKKIYNALINVKLSSWQLLLYLLVLCREALIKIDFLIWKIIGIDTVMVLIIDAQVHSLSFLPLVFKLFVVKPKHTFKSALPSVPLFTDRIHVFLSIYLYTFPRLENFETDPLSV